MPVVKSAINECRDQLFLDRADGKYLSTVSSNLGVERPILGFAYDDLWRAVVRRLAIDTRQITTVFRDLLDIMIGPQHTAVTMLGADVDALDEEITITDGTRIPQLGTLTIDPGTSSEEIIDYSFRDPRNGVVTLSESTTKSHTALVDNALSYLTTDYSAGATSIVLMSTLDFPTPSGGDTVPIIIGVGTDSEEVVLMSNNDEITSTLTTAPLVNDHVGPVVSFTVETLDEVASTGDLITIGDVSNFPSEGYIRITEQGGGTTEDVFYSEKWPLSNQLVLNRKLTNTYTTAYVNLLRYGDPVQAVQILVNGVNWDIFQTETRVLKIYIPKIYDSSRLIDASFLHGSNSAVASSTVGTSSIVGDESIVIADASSFPSAGVIRIDSGGGNQEDVPYGRIDRFTTVVTVPYSSGVTEIFVNNASILNELYIVTGILDITIDRGGGNEETLILDSINLATNLVVFTSVTANAHAVGEVIEISNVNKLWLLRPMTKDHTGGETVDLYYNNYAGENTEDGRQFTATPYLYQGPYLWTLAERSVRSTKTTLDENLAGPTSLEVSQLASRNVIEVRDASQYNTDYQQVRIGRNLAGDETVDIDDIVLRRDIAGVTLASSPSQGDTTFTLSGASGLPESTFGFRLFIDDNVTGGNVEEVVIVKEFVSGTNVVTLEDPLAYAHTSGDSVSLLADLIVTDVLGSEHEGRIPYTDRKGLIPGVGDDWSSVGTARTQTRIAKVEERRAYIEVVSESDFNEDGGYTILNFANSTLQSESRLADDFSAGASSIDIEDGSDFPTSNFVIAIGVDTRIIETIEATSRTGDTITLGANLYFDHAKDEWVKYLSGDQETLLYTGKSSGKLTSDTGFLVSKYHAKGETIHQSDSLAEPTKLGNDHPLYLPSDLESRMKFIFDLARAAGVKVEVITSK